MPGRLEVAVVTPEREVFSGETTFVRAKTLEGELGVLPGHAPLSGVLDIAPVIIGSGAERVAMVVDGGFLHVVSDGETTRVSVLAEHALLVDEIDAAEADRLDEEAARLQAEQRPEEARTAAAKAAARRNVTS